MLWSGFNKNFLGVLWGRHKEQSSVVPSKYLCCNHLAFWVEVTSIWNVRVFKTVQKLSLFAFDKSDNTVLFNFSICKVVSLLASYLWQQMSKHQHQAVCFLYVSTCCLDWKCKTPVHNTDHVKIIVAYQPSLQLGAQLAIANWCPFHAVFC